ncbi:MAG TPA: MMPL family transporter, partial [Acidimicrobiales bacterium]
MLQRIARFCYHRRWLVVATWVLLLIAVSTLNGAFGGTYKDNFQLPDSDSEDAFNQLKAKGFGNQAGFEGQVVVENANGFDDPTVRQGLDDLFTKLQQEIPDTEVVSPFTEEGARQISPKGTIAYAQLNMADRDSTKYEDAAKKAKDVVKATNIPGTEVELGGQIFGDQAQSPSELIGIVAAMVILLIAFGSVVAMGLPIMTALFGIGTGIALVGLTVNLIGMPSFSEQAVMMIGIGVGIDYALFIVTRYRENLHAGAEPDRAVVRAIDTSGRAVLFAGTTVILAVLGLFTVGLDMMNGLAIGISLGVFMTMAAALTLLPAVLGFAGRNIDKLGLPHRKREEGADTTSIWYRWSRVIQHRPWPALLLGALVLGVLAAPLASMRLGLSDAGNNPRSDTTRKAYDLLSEGFGPGFNGPFLLVAETPDGASDLATLEQLQDKLNQTKGVAFASPPQPNEAGDAAVMQVIPTSSPQAKATSDLVHTLRDDTIPGVLDGTGVKVLVGGTTAMVVDFSAYMGERLPWFMGTVLLLSFVLLMLVFRSLLVPLKAVIMNLISVGAAYGILVAIFQWGWGMSLFGVEDKGPVEMWIPMMLFAVVFGMSMDYEVFLLSRIREEYDRSGDNAEAVANGLAATARVITAAALIMVCVFGAFVLGPVKAMKMFGTGLAVAVFLDATVVRMVLVPATMELLGDANWWLPKWLDRILPVVHVEAGEDVVD